MLGSDKCHKEKQSWSRTFCHGVGGQIFQMRWPKKHSLWRPIAGMGWIPCRTIHENTPKRKNIPGKEANKGKYQSCSGRLGSALQLWEMARSTNSKGSFGLAEVDPDQLTFLENNLGSQIYITIDLTALHSGFKLCPCIVEQREPIKPTFCIIHVNIYMDFQQRSPTRWCRGLLQTYVVSLPNPGVPGWIQ